MSGGQIKVIGTDQLLKKHTAQSQQEIESDWLEDEISILPMDTISLCETVSCKQNAT